MSRRGIRQKSNNSELAIIEELVIKVVRGSSIPSSDGVLGSCDPYVKAWIQDHSNNKTDTQARRWPAKYQTREPVWNSARSFGAANGNDVLYIELWDQDSLSSDDLLGTATVPISKLSAEHQHPLVVKIHGKKQFNLCWGGAKNVPSLHLALVREPALLPIKKVLYIIRHGESVWNKAQSDLNVVELVTHTDHPLNEHGIQQAQGLAEKMQSSNHELNEKEKQFMATDCILASPLTRAIHTTMVALQSLLFNPSKQHTKLRLMANAREKRNAGGRDSSGQAVGPAIRQRVLDTLKPNFSESDWKKLQFEKTAFDTEEVDTKWWIDHKEPDEDVFKRMDELMWQLRYMPDPHIILVGHSHFFRAMMQRYLSKQFTEANAAFATELCDRVLMNCGVMRLELDYSAAKSTEPMNDIELIRNAEFLFGSSFK